MQIQHPISASDSGSHDRGNDDRANGDCANDDRAIDPAPALDRIALALVQAHFADFRRRITLALGVEHLEAESLAMAWTTGFASRADEIAPPPSEGGEAKNQRLVGPKSPPSGAGATPTS